MILISITSETEKNGNLVSLLRLSRALRNPLVVQKILMVRQVLVQADPRTVEGALGKAQPATQHLRLELPGT